MIKVVAAVIEEKGKFLLCKRGPGGNCPFFWEFPGGKIEPGETPEEALVREIREELSVDIEISGIFCEYSFSYPEKEIYFYFINAKIVSGKILPTFHVETKWLSPPELDSLDYCPADVEAAKKLKGAFEK